MTENPAAAQKARHLHGIRLSTGDRVFMVVNFALLCLIFITILYPLLYVVSASFSGGLMTGSTGLSLIPAQWTLEGYKAVLEYRYVWSGYLNSILYTVIGTAEAMVVQTLCAYALSRKNFLLGVPVMALCVFSMYFDGGLIPGYLLIKNLGMLDTIWSVTLPFTISMYNMIVMRTYFRTQIPDELLEASQIDGCGNWRFLMTVVLPLSGPILAVITLYSAVYFWNSYFYPLVYLSSRSMMPLPNVLREILILNVSASIESGMDASTAAQLAKRADVMKYSLIIFASVPVLMLYPFVQKYFVKGVMIGAVKG
ncbi:MAG: carbohydrate ABC transporter permease [Clostridiales bacterium]|nr:carbohydrate ABC transporter permease [Clostridiales bacterium]